MAVLSRRILPLGALVLALATLLAACSPGTLPSLGPGEKRPPVAVTVVLAPTPTPDAQPALPASNPVDPAVLAKIEPILAKTVAIRSLPAKGSVPIGTIARPDLYTYLTALFERQHTKKEIDKEQAVLVMLDLMRPRDSLYLMQLNLLQEQIIGLYDFEAKEMRLVGNGAELSPLDELTLSHEFVHALQDQNFDVGNKLKQVMTDSERASALQSLIEGDATVVMSAYAQRNLSQQQIAGIAQLPGVAKQDVLKSAPTVLQLGLLFPYQQGATFTGALYQSGGWAAVDKAYESPPTTVSQIIHPQKYVAGQGAQPVAMPKVDSALGQDWFFYKETALGELGVYAYLVNGIASDKAKKAAEGWAGDKVVLYRNSTGYDMVLVAAFTWDTPQDAQEFLSAVKDLRQPKGGVSSPDANHLTWSVPDRKGYLAVNGNRTVLGIATTDTVMKKILPALSKN